MEREIGNENVRMETREILAARGPSRILKPATQKIVHQSVVRGANGAAASKTAARNLDRANVTSQKTHPSSTKKNATAPVSFNPLSHLHTP